MRHRILAALLMAGAVFLAPGSAAAQDELRPVLKARTPAQAVQHPVTPPSPEPPAPTVSGASANVTFNDLQRMLTRYPPSVRRVLRLDPSLLQSADYLAPYPELAAFVKQHPEIIRNPAFFLGRADEDNDRQDPRVLAIRTVDNATAGTLVFAGLMLALWMIVGLLRQVVDYRRWLRQSRVQAEASTKVLDRLASNEDLLAFLQTPAGVSLVQAAPPLESSRTLGMPFGRILWSVQAGIVLAAFGIGLRLVQGRVIDEVGPAFAVAGTVAFCVGIGFVVSAVIAWLLASRVDSFTPRPS